MGYTKAEYIEKLGEDVYNALLERNKQYYQEKKEQILKRKAERKEIIREQKKQWRENNKDRVSEQAEKYRSTKKCRAKDLKHSYSQKDFNKGFPVDQNITADWIMENIFTSKCIYCGDDDWTHLGADRIDNNKPHTPDNCVCACGLCNFERADKYSVEEFKEYRKTHPRKLGGSIEKSWEIVEQNGVRVIKKKN